MSPAEVRTGTDGLAATTWTTMALFAEQFASARVEGGPTVSLSAIATPIPTRRIPSWSGVRAGTGSSRPSSRSRRARRRTGCGHRAARVTTSCPTTGNRRRPPARRRTGPSGRCSPLLARRLPLPLLGTRCRGRRRDVRHHHRHRARGTMIAYEVTSEVEESLVGRFEQYMRETHIPRCWRPAVFRRFACVCAGPVSDQLCGPDPGRPGPLSGDAHRRLASRLRGLLPERRVALARGMGHGAALRARPG